MRLDGTFLPLATMMLLAIAMPASGIVEEIRIEPYPLSNSEPFTVTISGAGRDTCWYFQDQTCQPVLDANLVVEVVFEDSGGICGEGQVPYEVECTYAPLPAGRYYARVHERLISEWRPEDRIVSIRFEVQLEVRAERDSWSRIKALYSARD